MKTLTCTLLLLSLVSASSCQSSAPSTRASRSSTDGSPALLSVPATLPSDVGSDDKSAAPAGKSTDERKGAKPDVGAGRVAWFDVTTEDIAKSREFYEKLFGWKFTSIEGTDLAVEIVAGDVAIGTLRRAEGTISAFNGVVYVQVDDLRASCKLAKDLGAKIPPGFPFDLDEGRGAIGLFTDPSGHPMGMYSRTPLTSTKPAKPAK